MDSATIVQYLIPALLLGFLGWRTVRFAVTKRKIPGLVKEGAVVVDVRSEEEFAAGHAECSINIPLQSLPARLRELEGKKTIVVCCASGGRAASAEAFLRRHGFRNVLNAGAWQNTRG